MRPGELELGSGLIRLRSKEQAREYMEALLGYYKGKSEEYGGQMGELLRTQRPAEREPKDPRDPRQQKEAPRPMARGWLKMGSLPVNSSDPQKAMAEVTLKIVDDYKTKAEKTSEALKSLDEIESRNPGPHNLVFFVNRGIPEAVIVEEALRKQETFAFSANFRAV